MHLVGWVFRYSYHRRAYVLRGIGDRFGPVLTTERTTAVGVGRGRPTA